MGVDISCRNLGKAVGPPQVYSTRNILFVSRAILLLHRLICCITWVASNLPKYALAKLGFFLLGLRASKSLGLPNPSLSAPQRRRKTPTWQMEDLLGRKGEDMKTKSGKKYHSSNARPSSAAAARRGSSSSDSGEATCSRRTSRLTLSCRRCPPSIHEFL